MIAYENETRVPTVEADIFFDETPEAQSTDSLAMFALLGVVFQLGCWAGCDPLKQFAARTVMRQETESPSRFANEHGVSTSYIRRLIRQANAVIGSAPDADK